MKSTAVLALIFQLLLPVYLSISAAQPYGISSVPFSPRREPVKMPSVKSGSVISAGAKPERTVRRIYLMGTSCTIQYYSPDPYASSAQIESLIRQLEEAEKDLSTWKETSILSQLNRQPVGVPFPLDSSLFQLFKTLRYWSAATANAFDPTVGRLLDAYGSKIGGKWPNRESIREAKANTGMNFYSFDETGNRITKIRDIEVDSGSFGKGEALDRLSIANTASNAWLVDLGGQILVHGLPPGRESWQITIAHPKYRQEGLFFIDIHYGSLATSGGSERDLEVDNRRLGHIINPNTGYPSEFNGSVCVWHEQALVADILSTALYVMGSKEGLSWADSQNIAACFLVTDGAENVAILPSSAFTKRFLNKQGAFVMAMKPAAKNVQRETT